MVRLQLAAIAQADGGQAEVLAGDHCAVAGEAHGVVRQIDGGHQHRLRAVGGVDGFVDHPDDVLLQGGDLRRGQRHAGGEAEVLGHVDALVHQRLELLGGVLSAQRRTAGQRKDLVTHQLLLVITVTQALVRAGRVVVQLLQHVIAANEVVVLGEAAVGLYQVRRRGAGVLLEQLVVGQAVQQAGLSGAALERMRLRARLNRGHLRGGGDASGLGLLQPGPFKRKPASGWSLLQLDLLSRRAGLHRSHRVVSGVGGNALARSQTQGQGFRAGLRLAQTAGFRALAASGLASAGGGLRAVPDSLFRLRGGLGRFGHADLGRIDGNVFYTGRTHADALVAGDGGVQGFQRRSLVQGVRAIPMVADVAIIVVHASFLPALIDGVSAVDYARVAASIILSVDNQAAVGSDVACIVQQLPADGNSHLAASAERGRRTGGNQLVHGAGAVGRALAEVVQVLDIVQFERIDVQIGIPLFYPTTAIVKLPIHHLLIGAGFTDSLAGSPFIEGHVVAAVGILLDRVVVHP